MSATFWDRFVTFASGAGIGSAIDEQTENEEMLRARFERMLNDKTLSPEKRLEIERQYQSFLGSRIDPIEGNAKMFADEAAQNARDAINKSASFVGSAVPVWVWIVASIGIIVYVVTIFGGIRK